jgi:methionyl-tRNA formyltransferase
LLFLGSGTFALPALGALLASPHEVSGLVTQPDRSGPGRHRHAHPVREFAEARGLSVFQPENINAPAALDQLREFGAELFVVAAYGQLLKAELLAIPRLGAINIHASLLPRHRGAAPIPYAILSGDSETGVSIFQIEPKLDAGPVYGQANTPIGPRETAGELEDRLSQLAAPLIVDVVDQLAAGTARGLPQDPARVTRAPKMPKATGIIDWTRSAQDIARHVRAMQPWPGAQTSLIEPPQPLVRVLIGEAASAETPAEMLSAPPGSLLRVEGAQQTPSNAPRLLVRTGDGVLSIERLQPAGKKMMRTEEFLRGRRLSREARFAPEESLSCRAPEEAS